MCGLVGYIGERDVTPILLDGLKRLEYRGYDSAGIATLVNSHVEIVKRAGKVNDLENLVALNPKPATIGLGHTRWATHGEPSDKNAHPHIDHTGTITLAHNGIIENYAAIRQRLQRDGVEFTTDTDTESLLQLISAFYDITGNLEDAVRFALSEIDGTYGIIVMSSKEPEKLIAARMGSPLALGINDGEYIVASDASAIVGHTRQVIFLEDGNIATLTREGYEIKTIYDEKIEHKVTEITFDIEQIEKGGYDHFMLKEIHEQPQTVLDSMRGRILKNHGTAKLGGLRDVMNALNSAQRILITACGTSWHAGLVGEYMLEQYARIPVEVEYASEFRYRSPIIRHDDVVIAISQSGETADTLAALREAKLQGASVIGICNVVGSTIARETHAGVYTHAGPEIGVASTKAFTSQLAVLSLLTLMLGRNRGFISLEQGVEIAKEFEAIPGKIQQILDENISEIKTIADSITESTNVLYLGRGYNFPTALEGALKLKEISYIHAEGYPAAEMKHGPIALIDENMPVIFIAPQDKIHEKVISNIEEVRARKGRVIAIVNHDDEQIESLCEHVIKIPPTTDFLTPMLTIIPLQLLSYYVAVNRNCDVDQPRNLAKSVTVE
ncbi:MAG: glutamine--fructose-6-phosphate transaminase (isomerizing) [Ectothiorhodospiraceae bacterium]|nr:glutamine--fructose-6-phosphate transaminase (isomerizing) [Ectothiorhodospiraceae bacterium]